MMETNHKSVLFAFDCDHTLVDVDSDLAVAELGEPLPLDIKSLCDGHYWTDYMNAVFLYLHNQGVVLETIANTIKSLPLVNGMTQAIASIRQKQSEMVIISDANDFGISLILTQLLGEETPSAVRLLTNRSYLTETGCLQIAPFHTQWECHFCPQNLCKGSALSAFIIEHGPFTQVVYVGDGKNDICPAMRLSKNDIVFARNGFDLQKIISKGERNMRKVHVEAQVKFWDDGFDILNHVLEK